MVMMDPTDVPKQRRRLNQAGRRARANRVIRGEMDYKGSGEDHKVHIRRDTPKGSTLSDYNLWGTDPPLMILRITRYKHFSELIFGHKSLGGVGEYPNPAAVVF